MELAQLEILETRVQEMIELIKRLKKEKAELEEKIDQREKECQDLQEERGKVRLRIEKLLGRLNHLEKDSLISDKGALIEK
ncbi:MAG: cell division protein ZapB [Nitrospiria bacterium]